MKKKILNYKIKKQKYTNSCWAAVLNSVLQYMNASGEWKKVDLIEEVDEMDSPIKYLQDIYSETDPEKAEGNFCADDKAIPTFKEIKKQINADNLFISNITWEKHDPDLEYQGGHWIAIIGYDDNNRTLYIHDPAYSDKQTLEYVNDPSEGFAYGNSTIYFANTSYIDVYLRRKK